jgi:hypothetical protein
MSGKTASFLSTAELLLTTNLTVMSGHGCSMFPKNLTVRLARADRIVHKAGTKLSVETFVR